MPRKSHGKVTEQLCIRVERDVKMLWNEVQGLYRYVNKNRSVLQQDVLRDALELLRRELLSKIKQSYVI